MAAKLNVFMCILCSALLLETLTSELIHLCRQKIEELMHFKPILTLKATVLSLIFLRLFLH